MKPNEVNFQNEQHLRDTVYNYQRLIPPTGGPTTATIDNNQRQQKLMRRRAKFKIGDYVRLSKYRTVFEKGYTPNWTTEIFTIRKVQYNTDPITYLLSDYQNHEISGSVYAEELQMAKQSDVYLVEKIIRRQGNRAYVKWLGFSNDHNSWILAKDIL